MGQNRIFIKQNSDELQSLYLGYARDYCKNKESEIFPENIGEKEREIEDKQEEEEEERDWKRKRRYV